MKTFKVTVKDEFFDMELSADIQANDAQSAIAEAQDFYAMELDTTIDYIEIIGCVEL